jgi:hypothetical protein
MASPDASIRQDDPEELPSDGHPVFVDDTQRNKRVCRG